MEKGIALAREYVAVEKKRAGDKHYDTAMAQAMLGAGLAFARKDAEAAEQFKTAIPTLLATARESSDDDTGLGNAADSRMQNVLEAYIAMLSRSADANAASEAFRAGERMRGGSVERALAASSARAAAKDPALAELARQEQDLQKQIGAQLGAVNNMLSLPPEERDDKAVKELQAEIEKLRTARNTAKRDMEKRFPGLRRSRLAEALHGRGHPRGAQSRRSVPVVLFRPARLVRLGGAQAGTGGVLG